MATAGLQPQTARENSRRRSEHVVVGEKVLIEPLGRIAFEICIDGGRRRRERQAPHRAYHHFVCYANRAIVHENRDVLKCRIAFQIGHQRYTNDCSRSWIADKDPL